MLLVGYMPIIFHVFVLFNAYFFAEYLPLSAVREVNGSRRVRFAQSRFVAKVM